METMGGAYNQSPEWSAETATSRARSISDLAKMKIASENVYTIGTSHAFWMCCTIISSVGWDDIAFQLSSTLSLSMYGSWLWEAGMIDRWKRCVDTVEAKTTEVASVLAILLPNIHLYPSFWRSSVAWIHWASSKRMMESPSMRKLSNFIENGWLWQFLMSEVDIVISACFNQSRFIFDGALNQWLSKRWAFFQTLPRRRCFSFSRELRHHVIGADWDADRSLKFVHLGLQCLVQCLFLSNLCSQQCHVFFWHLYEIFKDLELIKFAKFPWWFHIWL